MMRRALTFAVALTLAALVEGKADANQPHYHKGILPRYELGPPSVKISTDEEQRLRAGETIMQAIQIDLNTGLAVGSAGSGDNEEHGPRARRLLMVKDVHAPHATVTDRLLDYEAYPRMVKGCDKIAPYARYERARPGRKAVQCMRAKYNIHALHMRFTYFMVHEWDPEERSMVFFLDYKKRSDMDDSVGYWYLQPKGGETTRVYYSCVTRLRTWVPGPVYALLTKTALKQATVWIDYESVKQWEAEKLARAARRLQLPSLHMGRWKEQATAMRGRLQLKALHRPRLLPAAILPRLPSAILPRRRGASSTATAF